MTNKRRNRLVTMTRALSAIVGSSLLLTACTINGGDLAKENQGTFESPTPATSREAAAGETSASSEEVATPAPTTEVSLEASGSAKEVADAVAAKGGAIALVAADGAGEAGSVEMPAWSTMKVPVAIAALRNDPSVASNVAPAIQQSSNADAEALWASMGDPATAGQLTQAVMTEGGSSAAVQTSVVRAGFSSFGQTMWTLSEQALFATKLRCMSGAEQVVSGMSNVAGGQSYGLGQIPGAIFKGGWGPDEAGLYKVRQFGLVPAGEGYIGVAIAAAPADGTYESGQAILNQMAATLQEKLGSLKGNAC